MGSFWGQKSRQPSQVKCGWLTSYWKSSEATFSMRWQIPQNTSAKKRFDTVTDSHTKPMTEETKPEDMRKTTQKWLRVINNYIKEKDFWCDLAKAVSEELNMILANTEVNQGDGRPYGPSGMFGWIVIDLTAHPFNPAKLQVFIHSQVVI